MAIKSTLFSKFFANRPCQGRSRVCRGGVHPEKDCQAQIFAQKIGHGKIHDPRKSGKTVEDRRFFLCEPKLNIHNLPGLWKTPVEKPVEIVENSELSTDIFVLSHLRPSCGKVCIYPCIFPAPLQKETCYVTGGRKPLPEKAGEKVDIL